MANPQTGKWRHYKGGVYEVVRTAKFTRHATPLGKPCVPFRIEEDPDRHLLLVGDCYTCHDDVDYGDRVFYVGVTGRWARRIEDFLGQTANGQARFTLIEE